jgi:ABC-2 type transport system permease protein
LLALLPVIVVAVVTIDVGAPPLHWLSLGVALVCGSVPMALLAAAMSYWAAPKAALQIATLVFFTLTYAGGIWTSPESLPAWLQTISPLLPSRLWGEIAWASVQGQVWQTAHWLGLVAYTMLFGALAVCGHRRENQRRYD